jgi:hypothetical protein
MRSDWRGVDRILTGRRATLIYEPLAGEHSNVSEFRSIPKLRSCPHRFGEVALR